MIQTVKRRVQIFLLVASTVLSIILYVLIQTVEHPVQVFVLAVVLPVLSIILYLLTQLSIPTILTYPWPSPSPSCERKTSSSDLKTEVVLAGSYNPPHYGHLEMITYLARRYKKVHVVIGMNPNKDYRVTPAQRAKLLERMVDAKLAEEWKRKVKVEVVSDYIWRYAKSNGAKILFRGIRTWEQDGLEEQSLHKLNLWGPLVVGLTWPLQTRYMEGKPEYVGISSTSIRKLCSTKKKEECLKALESFTPKEIVSDVYNAYGSI